jgi:hypothetical protein
MGVAITHKRDETPVGYCTGGTKKDATRGFANPGKARSVVRVKPTARAVDVLELGR